MKPNSQNMAMAAQTLPLVSHFMPSLSYPSSSASKDTPLQ